MDKLLKSITQIIDYCVKNPYAFPMIVSIAIFLVFIGVIPSKGDEMLKELHTKIDSVAADHVQLRIISQQQYDVLTAANVEMRNLLHALVELARGQCFIAAQQAKNPDSALQFCK